MTDDRLEQETDRIMRLFRRSAKLVLGRFDNPFDKERITEVCGYVRGLFLADKDSMYMDDTPEDFAAYVDMLKDATNLLLEERKLAKLSKQIGL